MREAVIVSYARTAITRAGKGRFKDTRPENLAAEVIKAALFRAQGLKPQAVEDVVLGCAMPEAEQGLNIARNAALLAKLPVEVPAVTVNRFCSSGVQAVANLAEHILAGAIDIGIAGGVESMTSIPWGGHKFTANPQLADICPEVYTPMGNTAENVARKFGISREDQDRFAFESHQKAVAAQKAGKFKEEIIPITTQLYPDGLSGPAKTITVEVDEGPRADTTVEKLATLKPAFDPQGSVTAGNASPVNDGAAALVVMELETAKSLGLRPLAAFRHFAVAGVPPEIMGIGPVPAVRKLLQKTGLKADQIDLFELNEAFASQSLYCIRELGLDPKRVNVNGGAIALGHPLGATGARLTATLLNELEKRQGRYGIVTMCIGGGMGAACLYERLG